MKRPSSITALVLSAAVGQACDRVSSANVPRNVAAPAQPVKVVRLEHTSLVRSLSVTGTLAEQVTLALKVTGRLEDLSVDLGSHVSRGQIVARLNPTDFELRLRQATAALQQARVRLGLPAEGTDDTVVIENIALVRQQKALLDESQLQRDRIATFVARGISAKADLDTAHSQWQVAEARYEDALEQARDRQAVLAQRRSELALAQQQLEDSTLRSPIDGIVRERLTFAGEYRAAGSPVVTVVRQHPLRLQLSVPERDAAELRVAQKVLVKVEGDPETHDGRVVRLSPAIVEGNRTLPIEAEVPNPHGRLRPGTFARAEIITGERAGLVIPHEALLMFAGVEKVYTVAQGKAAERRVRTGRRLGDTIEVLDGLQPGDMVIATPSAVTVGAAVDPRPQD